MENQARQSYSQRCLAGATFTLAALSALTAVLVCAAQQTQPALQITSPGPGTVVNPGQVVSVSVSSPTGTSFSKVAVAAEDPLVSSSIATSVPAQLSILVPADISPGTYMLTAVGTTSGGKRVQSPTVLIDVERPDQPTSISAAPSRIFFRSVGQRAPLEISAKFPDGSTAQVTRSSLLAYTSSNANIATVDNNGIVTAVAKGSATITVTYAVGTQNVSASVPVTVPPPVTTSTPTTLDFGNQNLGTSSSSQTLTITNVSSNEGLKVGPVGTFGDFSEADNCGTSSPVAEGGMCTVNVAFRPSATGLRNGTVLVANSMDIVPLTIPLTGSGIGHPVTHAVNFGVK